MQARALLSHGCPDQLALAKGDPGGQQAEQDLPRASFPAGSVRSAINPATSRLWRRLVTLSELDPLKRVIFIAAWRHSAEATLIRL